MVGSMFQPKNTRFLVLRLNYIKLQHSWNDTYTLWIYLACHP